jgi:uncharacterized protein
MRRIEKKTKRRDKMKREKDKNAHDPLNLPQDAESQFCLALKHYDNADYKEAAKWLIKAAEQGHPKAKDISEEIYEGGLCKYQNTVDEVLGSYDPDNSLGPRDKFEQLYPDGDDIEFSNWYMEEDEHSMEEASEDIAVRNKISDKRIKYARMRFNVGLIYFNGKDVNRDYNKAFKWWIKDITYGSSYYEGFYSFDTELFDYDNAAACAAYHYIGFNGRNIPIDYQKAFNIAIANAEDREAASQFILGALYYMGQGVKQNYKEAGRWLIKAAEKGYPEAQIVLGFMCERGQVGIGSLEDGLVEAYQWYLMAGLRGANINEDKNSLCKEMTPSQIEEAKRRSRDLFDGKDKSGAVEF